MLLTMVMEELVRREWVPSDPATAEDVIERGLRLRDREDRQHADSDDE